MFKEEFNKLCYCLTLETLSDHPDYKTWTPYQGRLECFSAVRTLFDRVFSGEWLAQRTAAARVEPNHLITLLQQSALYQASLYMAANSKTSLPNPIHFDVLSPVFRAVDASGATVVAAGRRQLGEPKLIPGNVMRHMQRNFGVGGLTGKPLPVPGVVIEGEEKLGPQKSPRSNAYGVSSRNVSRNTAGQPLRSSWGWGNGSSRLTSKEISKVKKMVHDYEKPRDPVPLEAPYRHKKATKWEIPNDEGGSKAADQDEIVKAIQEEADNSEDAEEGEKGSLEQTQGQVSLDTGLSGGKRHENLKVKEVITQSADFSQKQQEQDEMDKEGKDEIVVQEQRPPEPRKREGALDVTRVRNLQCMAQCTETQPIRTVNFSPTVSVLR